MSLPNYPNDRENYPISNPFTLPNGIQMYWDGEKWKALSSADNSLRSQLAAPGSDVLVGGVEAGELVYDLYVTSSAFQRFTNKLVGNRSNLNIQVLSDSTGDETFEWPYKLCLALAAKYPEYSVVYKLWDDTENGYPVTVNISTGTGANTITMYNGAVSGSEAHHFLAGRATAVRGGVADFDLLMLNYGHNGGTDQTEQEVYGRHLSAYSQHVQLYRRSDVVALIQNINTGFADYSARMASGIARACGTLGIATVDVYRLWSDKLRNTGTVADWMNDGVHPNSLGHDQILKLIMSAMKHSGSKQPRQPMNVLASRVKNLLDNGFFSAWNTDKPEGWTLLNATAERDISNYETGAYSVKLTATSNGGLLRKQVLQSLAFTKNNLILAVRQFAPSSNESNNAGRTTASSTGGVAQSAIIANARDGWFWTVSYIPENVTDSSQLTLNILAGNAGDHVLIDRALLIDGDVLADLELDGLLPDLADYYNPANVLESYGTVIIDGNNLESTRLGSFGAIAINVFGLEVGAQYTVTWEAPSNTGSLLIRSQINDAGDVTTIGLTVETATFTAVNFGQSLSFRASTGQETININNLSIVKV